MPELPEVETFRRYLVKFVQNKKILDTTVYYPNIIKKPTVKQFIDQIRNQTIQKIARQGKYLIFFLTKNVLIVHFRMEGRFLLNDKEKQLASQSKHLLIRFSLNANFFLDYEDSRRFGTFHLENYVSYKENKGIKQLGLEPFDEKLTAKYLSEKWASRKINAKAALLEQTVIAGIGNIYACELLYLCKVSPYEIINNLNIKKLKELIVNLRKIMKRAIELNGTTVHTFRVGNELGEYWKMLKVYRKRGEKCQYCSNKIEFIKINQRGTFYCPHCQKKSVSVKLS